jgi:adenylate cyclase, class 2
MTANGVETEVKFLVHNLKNIEMRLISLGAQLIQPRIYEKNLRFDLPDKSLRRKFQVLRLRQDEKAIITFKGPGSSEDGIRMREELEVVVSDFDMARAIFEGLGYQVILLYEKYRATYALGENFIMLDEMPYGYFVEIEGQGSTDIFGLSEKLGLDKAAASSESYQSLFERARSNLDLSFNDLSFSNFASIKVAPENMGLEYGDGM